MIIYNNYFNKEYNMNHYVNNSVKQDHFSMKHTHNRETGHVLFRARIAEDRSSREIKLLYR
jgi:hypothetical protein